VSKLVLKMPEPVNPADVPINETWEAREPANPQSVGLQLIKDIEPYMSVAADVNGKAPLIRSRREHKEFLKRNGYIEIGNERQTPRSFDTSAHQGDVRRDLKQALHMVKGY